MSRPRGTVYLLHFHQPIAHARHYMGWTEDLPGRLEAHAQGRGARLMEVARERGAGWTLARTWVGLTKAQERQLKRRREAPLLCPLCSTNPKRGGVK